MVTTKSTSNVAQTCRYFGISRQTFYEWYRRYDPYNLSTIEDRDRSPKRKRQREISSLQEMRVVALRKQYIRYGKKKLAILYQQYQQCYGEKITPWKVQKVIERYRLYYRDAKTCQNCQKTQECD